jgi:arylsulfatase A-like enzyme
MAESPNILWIVTTQWRAQAFGFAGDLNARTPHLDRLAAESVNYSQAVTPHPFGPFARAAMLTGQRSPANGVADYFDPLPVETRTIAHDLQKRGYRTAFFGKWHLGERDRNAALVGEAHAKIIVPSEHRGGFEFWEGFESGFLLNHPWLHGSRLSVPREFKGYQSDVLCDRAGEFIADLSSSRASELVQSAASSARATTHSTPWFMVVSLEPPHPPYNAPSGDAVPSDPQNLLLRSNVPRGGEVETKARGELAGYYAHIEATDRAIGRLLESVNDEETVVVFTSVHGDMHGSHGVFRKGWPYEESVRVPLLVRLPRGGAMAHGENRRAISLVNLREMACGWADGRTLSFEAGYSSISMPSVVTLPHRSSATGRTPPQCDRVWRGVRTPDRKLILNEDGVPWLFFDLERDPFEMNNLVNDASRAAEIAEHRSQI